MDNGARGAMAAMRARAALRQEGATLGQRRSRPLKPSGMTAADDASRLAATLGAVTGSIGQGDKALDRAHQGLTIERLSETPDRAEARGPVSR
jgi:hypothetical protein